MPIKFLSISFANIFTFQSTVAPVQGAIFRESVRQKAQHRFQITHPCGVRTVRQIPWNEAFEFQSTHPCGVRHAFAKSKKIGY